MGDLSAFGDAFHSAGLSLSLRNRYNNFSAGQNPWINMQAPADKNLIACMLEGSVVLVMSGSVNAVSGADILDEWFQQLEVSPAAATPARIFIKTRKGGEELERLVFDTAQGWSSGDIASQSTHLGSYARSVPSNFTQSATRTDTSEYWFPIGGPAASVRLTIPPTSSSFASAVTSFTYTIGFFEVYSVYSGTVAAFENQTATLASGNNQDLMALNVFPTALAADLVSFVTQTTTNVTAVYMTDQTGAYVVNMDDTQSINASQYVYPRFATNSPTYSTLVFQLYKTVPTSFRVSLANSVSLDLLWIEVMGPEVAPANTAASTPSEPAVNATGERLPGSGPTGSAQGSASGGRAAGATTNPAGAAHAGGRGGGGSGRRNLSRILGR